MTSRRTIFAVGLMAFIAGFVSKKTRQEAHREAIERGRFAANPFQMTWQGWKDVLIRTWYETMEDKLLSVAAGVAFFVLLAFVPGLSVLISIYALFADPSSVALQLSPFIYVLPDAGRQLVNEQAVRLAAQSTHTLSYALVVNLLLAGWSANAGVKSFFEAFNIIYDEKEKRSFLLYNAVSLLTTLGAVVVFLCVLYAIAMLPRVMAHLPFSRTMEFLIKIGTGPAFYVLGVMAIAMMYWIGPSRRAVRFIWLLPGALLAGLFWVASSSLFALYASTLGNYTATYGSLAAVIVLMTWLWLSAAIVLIGAELNSELEHQTSLDTTWGEPSPRGLRGAAMADRIGPHVS